MSSNENFQRLLKRIDATILRNKVNLADLEAQREAIVALMNANTPAVKK